MSSEIKKTNRNIKFNNINVTLQCEIWWFSEVFFFFFFFIAVHTIRNDNYS